jgi:membrane-associated phospholipid phosphatase
MVMPRWRWAPLALALLPACAKSGGAAGEPTGGDWRPIVSRSAGDVPAPPARDSERARQELAQVLAAGKQRSAAIRERATFWNAGAVLRWNEIARALVAKHRAPHTQASRVYALVSVAQYDALVVAWKAKYVHRRPAPEAISPDVAPLFRAPADPAYPSEHAAVAGASAAVLTDLFPDEAEWLRTTAAEHTGTRLAAGVSFPSDLEAGEALGRRVAALVVERARADGSTAPAHGLAAAGKDHWVAAPDEPPVDPDWGKVRPWLMSSGQQFRAGPPPAADSAEFHAAVAEVRHLSDARTPEQARLAALWADGEGSYAPAGRWNAIAGDLVQRHALSELRAGRVFALLNMALMDAGISAWDTKYHYLSMRPRQVDPHITTSVREPNSPSYSCSHAAFSGAGAAVLAYLFPKEAGLMEKKAEEAAMSRVYAGIQFRFEGDAGLEAGRRVAGLAIERGRADGSR